VSDLGVAFLHLFISSFDVSCPTSFSMHPFRSQIKSKYKREERLRPALVDFALKCKTPIDMEEFLKKLAESAALEEVKVSFVKPIVVCFQIVLRWIDS